MFGLCPQALRDTPEEEMTLQTLPYDLLLNVTQYLDLRDVHSLHLTCKSLYDFSTTRPVYRKLANDLLRRCRALPLKGFQRLTDLTTSQLVRAVNKASRYERAWRIRAPRPITMAPYSGTNAHSNYMDIGEGEEAVENLSWYKVVSAPPDEDVDWLSPITSSYTLCATKSGKVVCWDVQTDKCLAEWNPGARWELWKCRVEFEERTVFFTMAKVLSGSYDDDRIMEFVLMQLCFTEASQPPRFVHVTDFKTTGVIMNVFLLDPSARLLSAFVWVSTSNTIGLYALLDWSKPTYVFIDTGIECVVSSNWSCILFDQNIVIHSEGSDAAFQYFYPISLLKDYEKTLIGKDAVPIVTARVPPAETLTKRFIFPMISIDTEEPPTTPATTNVATDGDVPVGDEDAIIEAAAPISPSLTVAALAAPPPVNPNPFPFPPWYPESAHFVRQWWPSLPGIPRLSCTVVLLASHDADTHRTRFILAQHYFRVPLSHKTWVNNTASTSVGDNDSSDSSEPESSHNEDLREAAARDAQRDEEDDALMRLWYVSTPFEVVCVLDGAEEDDDAQTGERPRPLVAVDFGHAVWIEYVDNEDDRAGRPVGDLEAKWLRFVTFPPFGGDGAEGDDGPRVGTDGQVRTLEIPDELDLDSVETINIDQSQGAVILSVKEGRIFILCYE